MPSMPRLVTLSVLVGLIVILGIVFFQVIGPFLLPLFLAGITAVLCQPIYDYVLVRVEGRVRVASGITTAAVMLIVLVPLMIGVVIASIQLYGFAVENLEAKQVERTSDALREALDLDRIVDGVQQFTPAMEEAEVEALVRETTQDFLQSISEKSLAITTTFVGSAARGIFSLAIASLVGLFIFMIALYYFLADGPDFIEHAEHLIPVPVDYQRRLLTQFNKVVRAVVVSTFFAAIAQALVTTLMLRVVGFTHIFLLFILATFSALIPLAGTWLVWAPCAVWLIAQGQYGAATFVAIVGSVVVGTLDNVIRAYILNSDAKLHPLLALISVLGGLQVMGLWGVFIGPIVASILHGLMVIFNEELTADDTDDIVPEAPAKIDTQPSDTDEPNQSPNKADAPPEMTDPETPASESEPKGTASPKSSKRKRGRRN